MLGCFNMDKPNRWVKNVIKEWNQWSIFDPNMGWNKPAF